MEVDSSAKRFKCSDCPYRAKAKGMVKDHRINVHLLHSGSGLPRPFPCPHPGCSYAAKNNSTLTAHSKIHSQVKSLVCSHLNCSYSTNHKESLISHIRRHTGEKPHQCQFESCSYAAATSSDLVTHSRIHTKERPYKCPEQNCEYSTARTCNFRRHRLTHPPAEGEEEGRPSFSCPLCEFTSNSKMNLSRHIKSHTLEKLFKCDEPDSNCRFEAKTKAEIKQHKLVHSDGKPFKCSFESCEYRCKVKSKLAEHLRTHSEERQYRCELCPFRDKTRTVVSNHIKIIHSDPDLRPFKCTEPKCDDTSKTKGNLKQHLLTHGGEKKYSCSFPLCDYAAILPNMIQVHQQMVHETEKRSKCGLCDFATNSKSNLVRHVRIHTKEEPYKCKEDGCEYRAKGPSSLRKHEKMKHVQVTA